ncbi:S-adenosyl-L-methionine-dependent methyltransferase [Lasiosphaeria hispida]|uniref:DNA (cytosine-5-)-methyltransferase n=1 Tax=Lasiosphaeria hispida TaxID=260671 RepID=A0AAJ0HW23_9PEZI|nr:S-adenosyl-L-methionine-dependent methyltransferase [Lasiosphaeria hispida]
MAEIDNLTAPGNRDNPLVVDDSDTHEVLSVENRLNKIQLGLQALETRRLSKPINHNDIVKVEDDDAEYEEEVMNQDREDETVIALKNIIDLTDVIDLTADNDLSDQSIPTRRSPQRQLETFLDHHIREDGTILKTGMLVELKQKLLFGQYREDDIPHPIPGRIQADFVLIKSIVCTTSGEGVELRGWAYARARQMRAILVNKINEVCLVGAVDTSDPRSWEQQIVIPRIAPSQVRRVRELRHTNAAFPAYRFDDKDYLDMGRNWVENYGPLVCRFRYIEDYSNWSLKTNWNKPIEWSLTRLSEKDVPEKLRVSDETLVNQWRGGKIPGGSSIQDSPYGMIVDVEERLEGKATRALAPGQCYSAGDTFAGAGGASRGITDAGLKLLFAVDHWQSAIDSLAMNFPDTDLHTAEILDFITCNKVKYRVDILHLSPPCQYWSPAHTIEGKNDQDNIASLFACSHLIEKVRPRLFTLEQTFGILFPHHEMYFACLIQGFATHGYSVRWKLVNLAVYGLPQPRKRLIIIGAGPGEKLPPFPPATHAKNGDGGLRELTTARQALSKLHGLDENDPNKKPPMHNIRLYDRGRAHPQRNPEHSRWNPDKPLPRTITCGGGQNYHWTGERDFTLIEYALLQGFPVTHRFGGTGIKRQIGNAFPPSVVKVLYKHLTNWLDEQDGITPAMRAAADDEEGGYEFPPVAGPSNWFARGVVGRAGSSDTDTVRGSVEPLTPERYDIAGGIVDLTTGEVEAGGTKPIPFILEI